MGRRGFRQHIGPYEGYKPNVNPTISIEFTSAVYRVGHSLLVSKHPVVNERGETYAVHNLSSLFFRPHILNNQTISDFFRGMQRNPMKEKSAQVNDQIRDLLFLDTTR